LDLAAGSRTGGLAHIATDITGFGVRFTLELLRSGWPETARGPAVGRGRAVNGRAAHGRSAVGRTARAP
jgi:hypothetical protein